MATELPVILAVDDDPEVLAAIVRDLRTRYRDAYRIMRAPSGESALEAVIELQREGRRIALFLVDQRMPGLSGTDFLLEARKYAPAARRVLLTAYADTDAAIRAINEVELDHYLLKPWEPPADRLYPVLDDLLERWRERAGPVRSGLRLA
ncbi:MAG: response regulator, partial [Gemmatimonadetes bacterium]|nr:response regulator [Gemmatimonadota bacterium]